MKKTVVLLLLMLCTPVIFAQDKPEVAPEKNVLKLNSLSLLVGTGSVFYERKISDMIAGQLGVGFLSFKLFTDTKFTGIILTPECKIYLKDNAIDGFYLSPYLRYHRFSLKTEDSSGSLTSTGGGLAFGRQWIFKKGFVIDFFFGGHYTKAQIKVDSGTDDFNKNLFDGFKIRTGLSLGFAF